MVDLAWPGEPPEQFDPTAERSLGHNLRAYSYIGLIPVPNGWTVTWTVEPAAGRCPFGHHYLPDGPSDGCRVAGSGGAIEALCREQEGDRTHGCPRSEVSACS